MRRRTAELLEQIGVHVPSVDLPVERSGGQRQAIAVARGELGRAHPASGRAAGGHGRARGQPDHRPDPAPQGEGPVDRHDHHNDAQTLEVADRIMLMRRGGVTYEKEAASTSVPELMDIMRREYRALRAG